MHGSPSFIPSRVQNVLSIIKSLKRVSQDCWSATAFMRVFLVFLLTSTFVLGSWTAVTPRAHAAALRSTAALATHSQHTSASPNTSLVSSGMNSSGAGSVDAIGEAGFYTYVSKTVNDHLTVRVNVGNGNLVVHASDLHIQGTKLDLSIERFYNVQSSSTRLTDLSTHWNLSTGADVYLQFNGDGSITFFGPSGQSALFNPNGSSGFLDPTGLNATLTKPGNYQLTYHKSGESFLFGGDRSQRYLYLSGQQSPLLPHRLDRRAGQLAGLHLRRAGQYYLGQKCDLQGSGRNLNVYL